MNKTKKLAYVTMLSALAIVINIIENSFIPELPMGIRFGLANIIALVTINIFGIKEMLIVNIMRVTLGNLLAGTIFGTRFFIAMGGIVLSSMSLIVTNKLKCSVVFSSQRISSPFTIIFPDTWKKSFWEYNGRGRVSENGILTMLGPERRVS